MNTTRLWDDDDDDKASGFALGTIAPPDISDHANYNFSNQLLIIRSLVTWYMRLEVVISAVIAFSTVIVLVIIAKEKSFHNTTNFFIANLMASDFVMAICCAIDGLIYTESTLCGGIIITLQYVTYQVSASTLILLTLTRYDAVLNPLRSINRWSGRRVLVAIGVSWLVSFLAHIPSYYLLCLPLTSLDRANHIYNFIIMLVVPVIILIVCYSRIAIRVIHNKFRRNLQGMGQARRVRAALHNKLTRMVIAILLVFIILRSPRATFTLYKFMTGWATADWLRDRILLHTFLLLNQLNCAVDPFIYAFCAPQFRRYLAGKLCCPGSNDIVRKP